MPTTSVRHQLERAYGRCLTDVLGFIGPYSVARASMAQVHRATLKGPVLLGCDHPVAQEALGQTAAWCDTNALGRETEVELAELLVDRLPAADRAVFSHSGTESAIHALRLSRVHHSGARLIAQRGVHFRYFGDQSIVRWWFGTPGPAHVPGPIAGCPGRAEAAVRDIPALRHCHPRSRDLLRRQVEDAAAMVEPPPATTVGIDHECLPPYVCSVRNTHPPGPRRDRRRIPRRPRKCTDPQRHRPPTSRTGRRHHVRSGSP